MAPDMRLRVVSLPATISNRKKRSSSNWSNFSPSTSASMSTEIKVCPRLEAPIVGELFCIRVYLHGGFTGLGIGDLVLGVFGADHPVRPVEDHPTVLLGNPEELGDHEERELGRQLHDEVCRPTLAHRSR